MVKQITTIKKNEVIPEWLLVQDYSSDDNTCSIIAGDDLTVFEFNNDYWVLGKSRDNPSIIIRNGAEAVIRATTKKVIIPYRCIVLDGEAVDMSTFVVS